MYGVCMSDHPQKQEQMEVILSNPMKKMAIMRVLYYLNTLQKIKIDVPIPFVAFLVVSIHVYCLSKSAAFTEVCKKFRFTLGDIFL